MTRRKRALAILSICCVACTRLWAAQSADTLVIEGVDRVKIETRDTVQRIVISGSKDSPYLHYVQRISIADTSAVRRSMQNIKDFNRVETVPGNDKWRKLSVAFHARLGLCTMVGTPADCHFNLWTSFEVGAGVTLDWKPFGKRNVWSIGLGMEGRNYRMKGSSYWEKDQQGGMTLTPYSPDQKDTKTALNAFSLQMPLLYTHHLDDHDRWAVTVGGVLSLNTGAHATRQFTLADEQHTVKSRDIGQRLLTADALLIVDTPGMLSLYCKYSPTKFFKNNHDPNMHQLSFGIYF